MTEQMITRATAGPAVPVTIDRNGAHRPGALTKRERDYLFLTIFVRIQHLQFAEALTLIEVLAVLSEESAEIYMARAVVNYQMGAFEKALIDLQHLDRIAPPNMMSSAQDEERSRMRSFMKAKCSYALDGGLDKDAQASLDFYLRRRLKKT